MDYQTESKFMIASFIKTLPSQECSNKVHEYGLRLLITTVQILHRGDFIYCDDNDGAVRSLYVSYADYKDMKDRIERKENI